MNVNVRGAFWVSQAFIPLSLAEKKPLAIINMSSAASSLKGVPNRCAYSVSKGALIALTKSIAAVSYFCALIYIKGSKVSWWDLLYIKDYVGQGIRANNICPGTVDTPSFRERVNQSPDPVKAMADFIARQKMGRLGTADEIAALALYLACDEVINYIWHYKTLIVYEAIN
jgi:NAD(P)-dependent dehydrogenase (short-subunit alcohol dehydrogenase family)